MEFSNSFTVRAPIEDVWTFMLDAREVAPCVPGATLTESLDATHHRGTVKVKLGAVQMSYRGELEIFPDEATRTIELRARGTETRGSGGASGVFHSTLTVTDDGSTLVEIQTKVDVTGRVAQFGRGIMQDVASRMIKEFAGCLEAKIMAGQKTSNAVAPVPEPAQPSVAPHLQPSSGPDATRTRPHTDTTSTAEDTHSGDLQCQFRRLLGNSSSVVPE